MTDPKEQRGGTLPDEHEVREKGEWAEGARDGIVPRDAEADTLDDAALSRREEGIAVWQCLAHVVNHGTQHRSEAAALLTAAGASPGEIDLIFFAEERAARGV